MALINTASASYSDHSSMMNLISDNEDVYMTVKDLAFLLATHGYDATPHDGYVEVHLDGSAYQMKPNGEALGLADAIPFN